MKKFDYKKWVTENKMDKKKLKDVILKTLEKEGGAAGIKALAKASKVSKDKLEKSLSKMGGVKQHQDGDYISTPINERPIKNKDPRGGDGNLEKEFQRISKAFAKQSQEFLRYIEDLPPSDDTEELVAFPWGALIRVLTRPPNIGGLGNGGLPPSSLTASFTPNESSISEFKYMGSLNEKEIDRIPTDTVFNPPKGSMGMRSNLSSDIQQQLQNRSSILARQSQDFLDFINNLPPDEDIQPLLAFPWTAFIRTLARFDIGANDPINLNITASYSPKLDDSSLRLKGIKEYEGEATYKFKPKSGEVGTPKNPGRKRPGSYTSMPIEEESLREVKDAIKKMISKNK